MSLCAPCLHHASVFFILPDTYRMRTVNHTAYAHSIRIKLGKQQVHTARFL